MLGVTFQDLLLSAKQVMEGAGPYARCVKTLTAAATNEAKARSK
jgi:hypothetical protein